MSHLDRHFNKGYLIAAAAAIVYLSFIFFSDAKTLVQSFEKIKWEFIALLVTSEIAVLFLRTARNRIFLKSLGINISVKRNILIYFAGLALSVTPGNTGEMVRAQFLKREVGTPISNTLPIFFAERLNDLIAVTIITSLFLFFVDFTEGKIVMLISTAIIIFMYTLLKSKKLFRFFRGKTGSIKFIQKFSDNFDQLHESIQNILGSKVAKKTLPASIPIWLTHGVSAYMAILAFGVDFSFIETYVIYFTSLSIGVMSFIPAGIGVTETSLVGLLTVRGLDFSLAVALTLVLRFATVWLATIIGVFASRILFSKQVPKNEE